jgi:hypothetical protein
MNNNFLIGAGSASGRSRHFGRRFGLLQRFAETTQEGHISSATPPTNPPNNASQEDQ